MSGHAAFCRRGWFGSEGRWQEGRAPDGVAQWHTAMCETPAQNMEYARRRALIEAPTGAEPFMFDTIPTLEERAMRYGLAMQAEKDWLAHYDAGLIAPHVPADLPAQPSSMQGEAPFKGKAFDDPIDELRYQGSLALHGNEFALEPLNAAIDYLARERVAHAEERAAVEARVAGVIEVLRRYMLYVDEWGMEEHGPLVKEFGPPTSYGSSSAAEAWLDRVLRAPARAALLSASPVPAPAPTEAGE